MCDGECKTRLYPLKLISRLAGLLAREKLFSHTINFRQQDSMPRVTLKSGSRVGATCKYE